MTNNCKFFDNSKNNEVVTASATVLNDPELSNIEKFLYSVLYAERMAGVIISLNEILDDS